ncbi:poly-beta-1,6-N-acetyl-D-glucosamine biosynthesis protein PgaD [Escherichia coli]|nr:poly-beta-1,6-N-acetyl-D-glucosamine biosynthesis protein PgaD [Escherichia coli]
MFAGKKSAQIREILISESAWEEMTCLFAPSLIVWALYNKLRFQKQQHHAAYQYTPQEYAESLAIPDELYQQLQKSHRMSVHFTSQGQIKMVVSEKALVRA